MQTWVIQSGGDAGCKLVTCSPVASKRREA
jgi:hypothetical protein